MAPENISPKLNPRHEVFIQQMILHGDKLRAYKAAYPMATDEAARTASSRLLKDPYVRQKLDNANEEIRIGISNDRLAFIHQELKIILYKRKMLLEIITGARKATTNELMRATRLDNELAEQQAILLGYGSIKPAKPAAKKNAETVTKMNNDQIPPSPAVASAKEGPSPAIALAKEGTGNDWDEEAYPGGLSFVVTNGTNYTGNSSSSAVAAGQTALAKEDFSSAIASAMEEQNIEQDAGFDIEGAIARYKIAVEKSDRYWAERRQQELADAIKGKWKRK